MTSHAVKLFTVEKYLKDIKLSLPIAKLRHYQDKLYFVNRKVNDLKPEAEVSRVSW